MQRLFYPPFQAETDEQMLEQVGLALRAYVVDLVEFDGEVLRDAWRDVRRTHKVARWPSIQEIRAKCAAARDRREHKTSGTGTHLTLEGLFRTGVDSRWIARCHGYKGGRQWLTDLWGAAPGDADCQCPVIVLEYFGLLPSAAGNPAEIAPGSASVLQKAECPPAGDDLLAGI